MTTSNPLADRIVRVVNVDRTRTPQQVLDATGRGEFMEPTYRKQFLDVKAVETMPRGEGDEVDVLFFKVGRSVSDADLEKEYELRGLKPCDPYTLAQVAIDDPAFADQRPTGTHWKDSDDRWCSSIFSWCDWGRFVRVGRHRDDDLWSDDWWFAGVRK